MQHTANTRPPLADFVDADEIREKFKNSFPAANSLTWFIRRHREELVRRGALLIVAGRFKFHPGQFEQVVLDVGQRAAQS